MYCVYMIGDANGRLYAGITADTITRIQHHNTNRGAVFTKGRTNFKLLLKETYPTLAEARKREIQIKKWRREKKELLIKRYQVGLSTKVT